MKILVLNCGSSSLKYQFFDMEKETVLAKGLVERIGLTGSSLQHQAQAREKITIERAMEDHQVAIELVMHTLAQQEYGVINSLAEIDAIGHRVVHGGERFANSIIIDEKVMETLKDCIDLAPLHNPPNIMGIEACQKLMRNVPQVAVFDTAFHQTMDKKTYLYGLPYFYYEKYRIRKYGFHGTSHKFVAQRAAEMLEKSPLETKVITCHLGNGSSITAVNGGKSKDTSMGFTPLEGLIMGTRCGNLDPAIIPFIMEKESLDINEVNIVLNKKSGLLGVSELSSDFRDLEVAAHRGNEKANLALDIFVEDVKKYIGAYIAFLGGVDAIVFTGGVGENSYYIREKVCNGLEGLGIILDSEANKSKGKERDVATIESGVRILVIPTNEELMIARETRALVG